MPEVRGRLDQIQIHGNSLVSLPLAFPEAKWDNVMSLKLMGNWLRELPQALGEMVRLKILNVSGNQLEALPTCVTKLWKLEWLFAYSNCLREIPAGLLSGSLNGGRLMLESNPLTEEGLAALIQEARYSWLGTLSL